MAATFDSFLNCVEEETAAGCATALFGCAFSGPAYPECVAVGCTVAFVGSVIHCAFEELAGPPFCLDPLGTDPFCSGWFV
jgi:hypothetical protein